MTRTILLADDSVTIQKVVELTFMDEDYAVVAVGSGDEALTKLAESRPDIVITDVHMPGATGYEVCRRAKEIHPGLPVLLLVGTFEVFDSEEAARAGADAQLKKPFDSQELLKRVDELLNAPAASAAPASAPPAEARTTAFSLQGFDEDTSVREDVGASTVSAGFSEILPMMTVPAPLAPPAPVFEPEEVAAPAPEPVEAGAAIDAGEAGAAGEVPAGGQLSDADVDRIAHRVVELLGDKVVRDVAWEVVPDLAEVVIKTRIRELEAQVE